MARQAGSSSSASKAPAISRISATSKKLFGGRRISTSVTKSDVSTAMSLNGPIWPPALLSRGDSADREQPLSSLPGLTRQSIFLRKTLCEDDGPPGQAQG